MSDELTTVDLDSLTVSPMQNGPMTPKMRAAKQRIFVVALAQQGIISEACKAAEISRNTYRYWMEGNEAFADAVEDAFEEAADSLEKEAARRAVHGYDEPVTNKDGLIYMRNPMTGELILDDDFQPVPLTIKRHSDRLLELLMKGNIPKYKATGAGGGNINIDVGGGRTGRAGPKTTVTIEFVESDGEGGMKTIEGVAADVTPKSVHTGAGSDPEPYDDALGHLDPSERAYANDEGPDEGSVDLSDDGRSSTGSAIPFTTRTHGSEHDGEGTSSSNEGSDDDWLG